MRKDLDAFYRGFLLLGFHTTKIQKLFEKSRILLFGLKKSGQNIESYF